MADLFGIDIAGLVAQAFDGQLREGVLVRSTPGVRDPNDPTVSTLPRETRHAFDGFVAQRSIRRDDTLIVETVAVMTILGGSLDPPVEPQPNDRAELDSITYELVRLLRSDPAGAAYEFEVA